MNDLISKAILSGLGFASLTTDVIRKTAEDLVKRSKLSEDEGRRLVSEFQRRSAQTQKIVEKRIKSAVHQVMKNLDASAIGERLKAAKPGRKRTHKSRRHSAVGKAAG